MRYRVFESRPSTLIPLILSRAHQNLLRLDHAGARLPSRVLHPQQLPIAQRAEGRACSQPRSSLCLRAHSRACSWAGVGVVGGLGSGTTSRRRSRIQCGSQGRWNCELSRGHISLRLRVARGRGPGTTSRRRSATTCCCGPPSQPGGRRGARAPPVCGDSRAASTRCVNTFIIKPEYTAASKPPVCGAASVRRLARRQREVPAIPPRRPAAAVRTGVAEAARSQSQLRPWPAPHCPTSPRPTAHPSIRPPIATSLPPNRLRHRLRRHTSMLARSTRAARGRAPGAKRWTGRRLYRGLERAE